MTDAFRKPIDAQLIFSRNNETVLVVEDDPDVRETTLQRVEGLGYVVVEAADAAEAIDILTREPDIAVVLCGIQATDDKSGLRLWIKQNKPRIKVVLTSDGAPAQAYDCPVLQKPFDRVELAQALGKSLYPDP